MKTGMFMGLVMVAVLVMPVVARADFFNDSHWYMNSSQWDEITDMDPENRGSLTDSADRLNWITSGWGDNYNAVRAYGSKWEFELSNDFAFEVEYHYAHTGTFDNDEGQIEMGLFYYGEGDEPNPVYPLGVEAGNWVWGDNSVRDYSSWSTTDDIHGRSIRSIYGYDVASWWQRTRNDGQLWARYNASEDELQFRGLDKISGEYEPVGGASYGGLRTELDIEQLRVYFAGWSGGAGLGSGDAYLKNFQVHSGTMTPEPASSLLFLIGGASLAAFRRRKRSSLVGR